jgi:NAD(P)-dependent dehydrogenase (short-subunit alcohol dehydrogenase family)
MADRKVAFITGASRGIGKACAIYLARAGFDVAITARTARDGEGREHSSTLKKTDTTPLPGSLESTAAEVRKAGREALTLPADLLDAASLGAAAAEVLARWGGVDVVVHNGRYIGPGHMDRFLDTPIELIQKQVFANLFAGLILDKFFIPGMIARGGGTIIKITSGASYSDLVKPAGEGGWGMGYGVSKAANHRVAGFYNVELNGQGIRAFNVDPGFTTTERMIQDMGKFGFGEPGAPVDVTAAVVAWLATSPEAPQHLGQTVFAQHFCHEKKLLPQWPGPRWLAIDHGVVFDRSAERSDAYENAVRQRQGKPG